MSDTVTCAYCDEEATRLCDGVIAHYRDDSGVIVNPDDALMCDAPLCDHHATFNGHHFCGPDGCDSGDYCPPCAARNMPKGLEVVR